MVALEEFGDNEQTPHEEVKALNAQTPLVGHTPHERVSSTHRSTITRYEAREARGLQDTRDHTNRQGVLSA